MMTILDNPLSDKYEKVNIIGQCISQFVFLCKQTNNKVTLNNNKTMLLVIIVHTTYLSNVLKQSFWADNLTTKGLISAESAFSIT